jgi:hypothetical protein
MKKTPLLLILIALYTLTTSSSCHKSNSPTNVLPPETHYGLNTMGCIVNGKLFIPQSTGYPPITFSAAGYGGYPGPDFHFDWTDKPNACTFSTLQVNLDSVQLQAGQTYILGIKPDTGNSYSPPAQWAVYNSYSCNSPDDQYYTNAQVTGQITLDYYDRTIGLVAGRFSFDAIDGNSDTLHVREGRFDMAFQN